MAKKKTGDAAMRDMAGADILARQQEKLNNDFGQNVQEQLNAEQQAFIQNVQAQQEAQRQELAAGAASLAANQPAELPTNTAAKEAAAQKHQQLVDTYGESGAIFKEDFERQQAERRAADDARMKALEDQMKESADIRQKNYAHFLDYANEVREAARKSEEDTSKEENAARGTSIFTAAGEFVNALANLGGTLGGATSQRPKTYAQNWQQAADRRNQELRANRRANRETLARLTNQLNALQTSNDRQALLDQSRLEDARYRMAKLNQQEKDSAARTMAAFAAQKERSELQQEKNDIAAKNAATNAAKAATGQQREDRLGSGQGGNGNVTLVFGATDNQPEETISIDRRSLQANILANINDVGDLSEEDKNAIEAIEFNTSSSTALADKLLPYVKKSPKLRELLKKTASGKYSNGMNNYVEQPGSGANAGAATTNPAADDPTGGAKSFFGL